MYYQISLLFPTPEKKEIKTHSQTEKRKIKCNIPQMFEKGLKAQAFKIVATPLQQRKTWQQLTASFLFLMVWNYLWNGSAVN